MKQAVSAQRTARLAWAAALFLACGAAVALADDFPTYQHDPQRTGLSTSALDPTTLTATWTSPGFHQPLIVGNSVFGVSSTQVASFNIANGQVNWSVPGSGSPTAYGGGMIVQSFGVTNNSIISPFLQVYDASTGAAKYSVAVPEGPGESITMATDTTTNQQVAYIADGRGSCTAVRLGPTSGTTLWTASGLLAGSGPSTVIGNNLLLANADHYYAINRTTGAVNQFFSGPLNGGLGYTPTADASRNQFYLSANGVLTAYGVNGNAINQLWQKSGTGIATGFGFNGGVALDANGNIYSNDTSTLIKIDPSTGNTLASASGTFSKDTTPIISSNALWDFAPGRFGVIDQSLVAYNLSNLVQVAAYTEQPNVTATVYTGASAIDDTHFVFDEGTAGAGSFIVSTGNAVPEPTSVTFVLLSGLLLMRRQNPK